jgi:RNA polymerase sigma factor (sigma-70 family)
MDDDKLLMRYTQNGYEDAFGQLVARHLSLVYSTCLRETGSPSQAEDAAQVVFLLLARKAKSLHAGPRLAGWLYRAARFVAKDVRKQEARRRLREETVMQEVTHRQEPFSPEWERIEPLLSDALSALKPQDRECVLLHFIEGYSLAETGATLGLSEDAARMRVSRAIEKMRRYLTAHGAVVTGAVLTGFLVSEAVRPVPANAANIITQGALQALSIGPNAKVLLLSKGVYQTMKMTKVKFAALAAGLVLGGTALVPLTHAVSTHYNHSHRYAYSGAASAWVDPQDLLDVNTKGKVPGNPSRGIAVAERIYNDIQVYRERHQGLFPPDGSALSNDRVRNLKAYGYSDFLSALRAYTNPDSRYADGPVERRDPAATEAFLLTKHRMDGSAIGSSEQAGTRDVLAYSDTYYHENIRRHGAKADTISPAGFYIVVWDDGEVQEVPFERTAYVKQPDGFMVVFPGQAGIPAGAVPFKTYWASVLHP